MGGADERGDAADAGRIGDAQQQRHGEPRAFLFSSLPAISRPMTDRPMGSIMMLVAVLLTHILMNAVAIMKPAICRLGWLPTASSVARAMRLCRFQRCIARPSRKPPRKRKMVGLA